MPFRHPGRRPRFGLLAALLQELGDEARPARLVACAHAGAIVAVEVFVEENQVAPVGVPLERFRPAEDRPAPVLAAQKDPGEPPRELAGDLPEVQPYPGPGRDRKSTRLNSSHSQISYAVFCLKKKKKKKHTPRLTNARQTQH